MFKINHCHASVKQVFRRIIIYILEIVLPKALNTFYQRLLGYYYILSRNKLKTLTGHDAINKVNWISSGSQRTYIAYQFIPHSGPKVAIHSSIWTKNRNSFLQSRPKIVIHSSIRTKNHNSSLQSVCLSCPNFMVWIKPFHIVWTKQLQLWWVLCIVYKKKCIIELYDTLFRNIIPIIGVKVQEYGDIMHIKTERYLPKISQFAVRYPQKYFGQGCIPSQMSGLIMICNYTVL